MNTLVIVEHDNHVMHASTRHVLTAAQALSSNIVLLVAGHNCQAVADEAAMLPGVQTVCLADDICFSHQLAEPISQLVHSMAMPYSAIVAASTTFGKNVLPRVAAMLDVAQISDVTRILDQDTFEHPIYAGNAIETVRVFDEKKVLTFRTTAFNALQGKQEPCCVERMDYTVTQSQTTFVERQLSQSNRPELNGAKIVVAGGRGLQSAEKFKLVEALADALNAAVGASRAAVDAGFVPNDYQVGQTGKIVAPDLYIAIGISGAVQHMAGMKDSKIIVAINKDADAPIFQIANYGLVGDLFELVPQLTDALRNDRS